ncbi:hypothetical protein D9757_003474 [Collybiopsis confluens]|uniref:Uncharacterized protein n=1 Tax=Collybiopsis confluens TaxID=2823264 RepID=A0A8H5MD22_9AGAR|nr:hypothetical protein D9757_003474 [Collybiopsis confluens]
MFTGIIFSSLFLTSGALSAAIFGRDEGCRNFPTNGVGNTSDYFTLWAVYDNPADGGEVPLAMSTFGTSANVETTFLAPAEHSGVTLGILFHLNNTGLVGIQYPDGNDHSALWVSQSTEQGGPLPFSPAKDDNLAGMAEDYCEVVSTDPEGSPFPGPLLAGEGTADGWSLCNRTDNAVYQGVVLNAAEYSEDYGYDFATCKSVHVFLRSST